MRIMSLPVPVNLTSFLSRRLKTGRKFSRSYDIMDNGINTLSDSETEQSVMTGVENNVDNDTVLKVISRSKSKTKSKRKSKYEILEDKMDTKLNEFHDEVSDKFDKLFELLRAGNCATNGDKTSQRQSGKSDENHSTVNGDINDSRATCSTTSGQSQRRPVVVQERQSQRLVESDNEIFDDDEVSILPRDDERLGIESETESETEPFNDVESNKEHSSKKGLYNLFGQDAYAKKVEKKLGIEIDDAQKQVLLGSWRTDNPNLLTAFAEEMKEEFPVHEDTDNFLKVPSIDELIGRCLVKKHGKRAALITKAGNSLYSQPAKMVEKIAYRGQQAAYMGIVAMMYAQRGLADLLQNLLSDNDGDKAKQQVRDIFAISTKCLDQLGRTGALHHIIRRQLAMTDTGLYEIEDARDLSDLPLGAEGVFGADLNKFLKERKEKNKALDDLLPDIPSMAKTKTNNINNNKRKATTQSSESSVPKKRYREEQTVNNFNYNKPSTSYVKQNKKYITSEKENTASHFRIPKKKTGNTRGGFSRKGNSSR